MPLKCPEFIFKKSLTIPIKQKEKKDRKTLRGGCITPENKGGVRLTTLLKEGRIGYLFPKKKCKVRGAVGGPQLGGRVSKSKKRRTVGTGIGFHCKGKGRFLIWNSFLFHVIKLNGG